MEQKNFKQVFIITGASRGLGEAIARALLSPDRKIICLSRSVNKKLIAHGKSLQCDIKYYPVDLSSSENTEEIITQIFREIEKDSFGEYYLINNAGVLSPIKPLSRAENSLLLHNLAVNLTAPLLLSSSFIKHLQGVNKKKVILNISSGAGKKAYYGWSAYCTAKAGLDHFTRCAALEQGQEKFPVKIYSIAPGIIDTQMQEEIRATSREDFIHLDRFFELKNSGQIYPPEYVAEKVIEIILHKEPENGSVLDIRDYFTAP